VNIKRALDLFLKGATRGATMAMVDVWMVYWEIRKNEEGVRMEAYMFLSLPVADLQSVTDGFYKDEDEFLGVDLTDVLVVGRHVLRDQVAVKSTSPITWKRHDQALLRSPQMDQYIST
ncbi:hypothetical protein Tco_0693768, partial [Tanacetum coccineum]